MSEQEPKMSSQGSEVPDSYVQDLEKARFMAESEDEIQEALSNKMRGENMDGKVINESADELKTIVEERGERSSDVYDTIIKNEKENRIEDYVSEHPEAVVDVEKARFMAEVAAPFEEMAANKIKESTNDFIEKYDDPISDIESEEMIIRSEQIKQAREAAMSAAESAGKVYDETISK